LRDQFNLSIEQISKRLANKSASAISNTVRLLKLPQNVKRALAAGELTEGQARPLIGLEPEMIDAVLSKMISEGWSTRKIEQYVGSLKADNAAQQKPTKLPAMPYEKESERLRKALGVVVNVSANARGAGQIVIKFKNNEEFERLNSKLVD
jgi:ParB family chromosome partitioning protein